MHGRVVCYEEKARTSGVNHLNWSDGVVGKIKKIQAFETEDGKVFKDSGEASKHAAMIFAEEKLREDNDFFHGGLGGVSSAEDLASFLARNEEWILPMMGWSD